MAGTVTITAKVLGFERLHKAIATANRGLNTMTATANKVADSFGKIGAAASKFGRFMSLRVTAPIAGVGVASVKMATSFEESLSKITGLVGVQRDQVDAWRKDILNLAPAVAKGPGELAEGMFFITSAGLRGQAALDALKASAQAASAGLGDTATIADAVTSAMNAYGADTLSAADATGILVAAVREGKASAETLAPVMGRVLPVAQSMGVEFHEVAAAIAAMSRVGFDAAEASTSVRATLTALLAPTSQAEDAMAKLGLSSAGLRQQLKDEGLLSVLSTLKDAVGDDQAAMAELVPNVRALAGVLSLVGSNAQAARDVFASLAKSGRQDLATAFEDAAQTSGFKFSQALQALKVTMIDIGAIILPIATDIAKGIRDIAERFQQLSPQAQRVSIIIAGLAAAVGPVALAFGAIASGIAAAIPFVISIAGPIAAIAAGLWAGVKAAEGFIGVFSGIQQVIADFLVDGNAVAQVMNDVTLVWLKAKRLWAGAKGDSEAVASLTMEIDELARANFELEQAAARSKGTGKTVADSFLEGWQSGTGDFKAGVSESIDVILAEAKRLASVAVEKVVDVGEKAVNALLPPAAKAQEVIKETADAAAEAAPNKLKVQWEALANTLNSLAPTAAEDFQKIATEAGQIAEELRASSLVANVEAAEAFQALADAAKQALAEVPTEYDIMLEEMNAGLNQWAEDSAVTLATWGEAARQTFDQFKAGVGDAVAEAIVEGQDLGAAMQAVLKNVAKSVISSLVQIAIQKLATAAIHALTNTTEATSSGARIGLETYGNAFASTAAIPIVGPTLAPAAASAALAAVVAGMPAAGAAGALHGGLESVPSEQTYLLQRGERVLSPGQNKEMMERLRKLEDGTIGGGDTFNITFATDSLVTDDLQANEFADKIVSLTQRKLRKRRGRGR